MFRRQMKLGSSSYTIQQIKILINHLIKDCVFTFANLLLLQWIDNLVGIDPALFWGNLYLCDCYADGISDVIKTD